MPCGQLHSNAALITAPSKQWEVFKRKMPSAEPLNWNRLCVCLRYPKITPADDTKGRLCWHFPVGVRYISSAKWVSHIHKAIQYVTSYPKPDAGVCLVSLTLPGAHCHTFMIKQAANKRAVPCSSQSVLCGINYPSVCFWHATAGSFCIYTLF